jgi:hypothetical protein
LAKNHEEEFKKLNNQNEYSTFGKIKEGEYFNDVVTQRKNDFV